MTTEIIKIVIPNALKKRFETVFDMLPDYLKVNYRGFEQFAVLSVELALQALEQIAENYKKFEAEDRHAGALYTS
jgi:hypothetical protein